MTARALLFALLLLLGDSPAVALDATPDSGSLPSAPAPFGIAVDRLPTGRDAVEARFARLPATIAGEEQQPWNTGVDRIQVPYGSEELGLGFPMRLGAIAFAEGDFFPPDFTAGDYVAMSLGTDQFAGMTGGRDGDIAWLMAELPVGLGGDRPGTPAVQRTMSTLTWGEVDGGWVFTAMADTPDRLRALVVAFMATGRPGDATPAGAMEAGGVLWSNRANRLYDHPVRQPR